MCIYRWIEIPKATSYWPEAAIILQKGYIPPFHCYFIVLEDLGGLIQTTKPTQQKSSFYKFW